MTKNTLFLAFIGSAVIAAPVSAELTANIGVTNNYLWRGVTQTDDNAAVSGGLDYSSDSGFYAGTWASNVDFGESGYELDIYAGFAGEVGDVGYDVGYIYYAYPTFDGSDFEEIYLRGSFGQFAAGIAYQIDAEFTDENYIYIDAAYDIPLNDDYTLSLKAGHYDLQDDGDDYAHFGVAVSKGEFSLGLEKNDIDGGNADDPRVVISWSREF